MIRVQREDFDVGSELTALCAGDANIGGVASFIGIVRDAGGGPDSSMILEYYPEMTERKLAEIEDKARDRWELSNVLIIHRYGELQVGEQIVLVLTASAHREAALEACHFLIDWLKTEAPFWKYEETADGGSWVEARDKDDKAKLRWSTE